MFGKRELNNFIQGLFSAYQIEKKACCEIREKDEKVNKPQDFGMIYFRKFQTIFFRFFLFTLVQNNKFLQKF